MLSFSGSSAGSPALKPLAAPPEHSAVRPHNPELNLNPTPQPSHPPGGSKHLPQPSRPALPCTPRPHTHDLPSFSRLASSAQPSPFHCRQACPPGCAPGSRTGRTARRNNTVTLNKNKITLFPPHTWLRSGISRLAYGSAHILAQLPSPSLPTSTTRHSVWPSVHLPSCGAGGSRNEWAGCAWASRARRLAVVKQEQAAEVQGPRLRTLPGATSPSPAKTAQAHAAGLAFLHTSPGRVLGSTCCPQQPPSRCTM